MHPRASLAALLVAVSPLAAAAVTFDPRAYTASVQISATTNASENGPTYVNHEGPPGAFNQQTTTGAPIAGGASSSFDFSMVAPDQPNDGVIRTYHYQGTADATGTAAGGALHAMASAFANTTPNAYIGTYQPFPGGPSVPFEIHNLLPGAAHASTSAYLGDAIHFFNPSLPVGADIAVHGTANLDATVSSNAGIFTSATVTTQFNLASVTRAGNFFNVPTFPRQFQITDTSDRGVLTLAPSHTLAFDFILQNGDVLYFNQSLDVSVVASAFYDYNTGQAVADASNTAFAVFTPDPGVTLTSASGRDYTVPPTPLPEPGAALSIFALVPLARRPRRA